MADSKRDWRELCAAVSKETNSEKLVSLVQELIVALDEGERSCRPLATPEAHWPMRSSHSSETSRDAC